MFTGLEWKTDKEWRKKKMEGKEEERKEGRKGRKKGKEREGRKERRKKQGRKAWEKRKGRMKERREVGKRGRNSSRNHCNSWEDASHCCTPGLYTACEHMHCTHERPGSSFSVYMCLLQYKHLSGSNMVPVFKDKTSSSNMAPKSRSIISTWVQLK